MALEKEGGQYFYQKTESLEIIKMSSTFFLVGKPKQIMMKN